MSPEARVIELSTEVDVGFFYDLENSEYATFIVPHRGSVEVGSRISVGCMFEVNWLVYAKQKVGFLFTTPFQVENGGSYLIAYMNNAKGRAKTVEVLTKTKDLVIYNFPNRGTIVATPRVGFDLKTML